MQFNLDAFSFLDSEEFEPGWTNLGQTDLDRITNQLLNGDYGDVATGVMDVVDAFFSFLDKIKPAIIGEFDPNGLISVHADEFGLIDVLLGPGIFKDENGKAVMKVGANLFAITDKGDKASCGNLKGDIEILEKGEGEKKYIVVALDCAIKGSEDTLSIPLIIEGDDDTKPKKGTLKVARDEGHLADFLKSAPTGSGFVKMNDLQAKTEYAVISIEERPTHDQYGRSWLITCEGVGGILSKGKRFEEGLAQNAGIYKKLLAGGGQLTLAVSSIKKVPQGTQVNAGFFKRAPRADRVFKPVVRSAELKSAEPVNAIAPAIEVPAAVVEEQKELVAAGSVDYDDIPF